MAIRNTGQPLGFEVRSCLIDVRADLVGADTQQSADLGVAETVQLSENQRRSLVLRQLDQGREHLTEVLPLLHLRRKVHKIPVRRRRLADLGDGLALAKDAQAGVASDREQPRAHIDQALVCEQCPVSGCESRLNRILGIVSGAEHVAAEGQQLVAMAVVEDLERSRIAATDKRHKSVIGGKAQPSAVPGANA